MQLALYNQLKARLETLSALKYVRLWNNQFEREDVNVSFNYPCCFIEFADINYTDDLNGRQRVAMTVNLHIGFESYKTEDTDILQLKQDINELVHFWSTQNNTKFLRRSEVQNFDHTNIQEYIISYGVTGIDVSIMNLPTTEVYVTNLDTNISPQIDNTIIRTGILPESVALAAENNYILTTEAGYELIIQQ